VHQRGRAAAVEVDRALGAQLDHHLGELEHRQSSVDVRAPPVARDRDERLARDAERSARVAPVADVRVELPGTGGEALSVVVGVEDDRAVEDEQWSSLHEITGRLWRSRVPLHELNGPVVDQDAAATRGVRRRDRLVTHRPAVDPELAERPVRVAEKEAPDDGLLDGVLSTPYVEALRPREVDDTSARGSPRIANGVQRRHLAVGQGVAPEQVLDPVLRRRRASSLGFDKGKVIRMTRVVILGAGFGGLELATMLSSADEGGDLDVVLIDKGDAFVFGYSKLDVMFGRTTLDAVRLPYRGFAKPGVRLLQETVTAIDPQARRVTTDAGVHEADVLVVALGADYDYEATPGLLEFGNEFYSVGGAERLADVLQTFNGGRAVVGVCGAPYKCPPAPSEAALLLHDFLLARGVRDDCEIAVVTSFETPIPPSPDSSEALLAAFEERDIAFLPGRRIRSLEAETVVLDDGAELPFDLFLGVPKHRAPDAVLASGLAEDGFVPVSSQTLETRFPGVYAVGDVATAGVPKAGVFAERAARVVAESVLAALRGGEPPAPFDGRGSCYIEFGSGRVGRVDIDFLSGPTRTGTFQAPSAALVEEKRNFGSSRRAKWFDAS